MKVGFLLLSISAVQLLGYYEFQMNYYVHCDHLMNSARAGWPAAARAGTHCVTDDMPGGGLGGFAGGEVAVGDQPPVRASHDAPASVAAGSPPGCLASVN